MEAETHSKRALDMVQKAYGDAHPIVASTQIALANTYSQLMNRFADIIPPPVPSPTLIIV